MCQGDCARVQSAQLGIQKAARKGILPLDLGRLVAVLRSPRGPLPLGLTEAERLLTAAHLESCDECLAFWREQLKLVELLGEAGFDLPPQATQLETTRLQQRVLELTSAPQSVQPPVAKFKDYLTEKREVRVSSKFQTKKFALVAAGALVVVLGIFYFSYKFPPVQEEDVQGAIGKRDVYRETNMTEKDVTADSGPGGPSYAGLVELLKSPEFKALANDSSFKSLVQNETAFHELTNNNSFQALCNQLLLNQGAGLVNALNGLVSSGLAQNSAFIQLFQNEQFQQVLASSSNFQQLNQSSAFQQLASNSAVQSLLHNSQFNSLMSNIVVFAFLSQNASSLADLSSMVQNAAYQQLAQNTSSMQKLLQNNAFNSLIQNQSFQFLALVSNLQNNSAFNSLVHNNNFLGLINSSQFQGLAGNQLFQQLLKDSNFHQIVMSQEQGSLVNNNQFNQLINSAQYQDLANNNQFQSLLHNNNFSGLMNNAAFHNLVQQNQFHSFVFSSQLGSYANSMAGINSLLQQSQELGIVVPQ